MGYELTRFIDDVDEEFLCLICNGVLENPAQIPDCEHAFCRECISEWLSRQNNCPLDRSFTLISYLQPVPRVLKNLLNKLQIKCENTSHGCKETLLLELIVDHQANCAFNPKRPITCENCNLVVPKDIFPSHNCVKELRRLYEECLCRLNTVENQLQIVRSERNTNQDDNSRTFRSEIRTNPPVINPTVSVANISSTTESSSTSMHQRTSQPSVAAIIPALPAPGVSSIHSINNTDSIQLNNMSDEIIRWVNTLPIARVTRWGGMISTPDLVLQAIIRRALAESGCPTRILDELMTNAHERSWPSGLQNLETRQINRVYYESYLCRRVPGRQAVVMMASDNRHMAPHMVAEPGIVMIFAHGVT